jgi:hypothetical protein
MTWTRQPATPAQLKAARDNGVLEPAHLVLYNPNTWESRSYDCLDLEDARAVASQYRCLSETATVYVNLRHWRGNKFYDEAVVLPIPSSFKDPQTMTTFDLKTAIISARLHADTEPDAATWADAAAEVLENRLTFLGMADEIEMIS